MTALDLQQFRVGSLPTVFYIPNYVSTEEEQALLTDLRASKQWRTVSGRRLQNLGGIIHKQGLISAPLPSWLQPLVARLAAETGIYGNVGGDVGQPNHVLVNAYQPGEGILPHEDGPLYHPAVAILGLGAPAVVRFAHKRSNTQADADAAAMAAVGGDAHVYKHQLVASVVCQPRSLLIFRDVAYSDCLHGILEAAVEEIDDSCVNAAQAGVQQQQRLPRGGERISLTVRRVLRTHKLGIRL
ncbi:hypothetical protein D9Q98_008895 [Chlorella vulgaris]|uniref:Fe2OG dioxygenase domain-containing protein n=1 Tax=Chlorella vulgaris TaxID=3077 RepID=A0A9D4YTA6_CHLVU|nr:hypothetical protein D9Q98_008895 [Chlorella vulgaris]